MLKSQWDAHNSALNSTNKTMKMAFWYYKLFSMDFNKIQCLFSHNALVFSALQKERKKNMN